MSWLARRLVLALPVWLGISLLAFGLSVLPPGDPAAVILQRRTGEPPSAEAVARLRRELGLDRPFPVRYADWLASAATGDLGRSYRTGEPVLGALAHRFPRTAMLALVALLLGVAGALPLGVWSAARRDSVFDHVGRLCTLVLASLPSYWLAYLLILFFAVRAGLLPVAGWGSPGHLVLPALTLAVGVMAGLSRLTRVTMIEELEQAYVRTARAKGVAERRVLGRHCLRNAGIPLVTVAALRFGHLLAGAVIVETVFAWPGIGSFVVDAIYDRDFPVIQGFVLFTGTVFLAVNLLADLTYQRLDPRVRGADSSATRHG